MPICLTIVVVCLASSTLAQAPDDLAPPPVKFISREDRAKLDVKDKDIKDRTKLTLELMDLRLDAAERLHANREYDAMFSELGGFHGLMDDGLGFLGGRDQRSGKVLDNYKRLEIGLRSFSPRIEVLRREIPQRYDDYLRKLSKYVREARTRATEPFFGETVIRDRKPTDP